MKWRRNLTLLAGTLCLLAFGASPMVAAQQSSSTNYQVGEVFFGTGGELNACSTAYCSKQAAGEMGVGNISSPNFSSQSGFNTDRTPYLAFSVTGGSTDLGVLSTGSASTTTNSFSVKTYLAGGYVVQTVSDPPKSGNGAGHTLANLTSPTTSAPGTEQFGINLVANTSPTTFGAVPVQIPNNTFSFGTAASGYNTTNQYKYVKGDTVASSTKSSGQTNFTISYLYNISNLTPAGTYVFNHVLVATSTF